MASLVNEFAWPRIVEAMRVLDELGPDAAGGVWQEVLRRMPPTAKEQEVGGPALNKIRIRFQWFSTGLARIGWISKPPGWKWEITNVGRRALADFPDPDDLRAEDDRLYKEWLAIKPDDAQRAWLIRADTNTNTDLVQRWLADEFVSLSGTYLRGAQPGDEFAKVRAAIDEGYEHVEASQRKALAEAYYTVLTRMKQDDIVAIVVDDRLTLGRVTSDAQIDTEAEEARVRRGVDWTSPGPRLAELPSPLAALVEHQGTLVDLTAALDVLVGWIAEATADTDEAELVVVPEAPLMLAAATDELGAELHMDCAWLQEVIDTLHERRQLVLFGPPGTGKTYLARALARHIADREAARLVQFHSSYSYEDFFQGFRPNENGGFELKDGPLRELALEAAAHRDRAYVLIIDEMNRGNLPKIFGELYFLLEYRDQVVRLQYSPTTTFQLPPNLFVIGTMNTADRSIAAVDAAIRRRFAFIELHPDEMPVRDVLRRWLTAEGRTNDERAGLLAALNKAIDAEDRDFKIGPSYLMKSWVDAEGGVERVWRHDLLPLLEEHYYGRLTRKQVHDRFGLDMIRTSVAGASASPDPLDVDAT